MQSSLGIRARIDHVYPMLRPAEQAVARFIRDNIDSATTLTVGQLAAATQVSEPTVIRFARKLGFSGYRELRFVLKHPQDEHKVTFEPLEGFDLNPWDNADDIPVKAIHGAKSLLDELQHVLDSKIVRRAVSLLATAPLIDVYGVENSLSPALDLYMKLSYLGLNCRLNADAYMQQIGAAHLSSNDVAIAFSYSGNSADTVKALRLAKSAGAHTIGITNTSNTALANWSDVCLVTGRSEHMIYGNAIFSRVAHTAVVDILYMSVILSDYGRFSTQLDRSGRVIQDREFNE